MFAFYLFYFILFFKQGDTKRVFNNEGIKKETRYGLIPMIDAPSNANITVKWESSMASKWKRGKTRTKKKHLYRVTKRMLLEKSLFPKD